MKRFQKPHLLFVIPLIFGLLIACEKTESGKGSNISQVVVDVDDYTVNMPDLEGYAEFKAACITCHSLRYIEMQPDFPQKTWETIVNKMVKNFGAVIPDSTEKKIVSYLTKVKGVE